MPWDLLAQTMVQEILQIVQANMLDYTTNYVWLRANYDFMRIDQMNIATRQVEPTTSNTIQMQLVAEVGYILRIKRPRACITTRHISRIKGLWMLARELRIVELMAIETSGGSSMNGSVLR